MRKKAILLGLVGTTFIAGASLYWWSTANAAAPGILSVDANCLCFGNVAADGRFAWKLKFKNTSAQEAVITGFRLSCSCLECDPKALTVAPGADAEINLKLNLLKAFAPPNNELFTATFQVSVMPMNFDAPLAAKAWRINGSVTRPVMFERFPFQLQTNLTRGQPMPTQSVKLKFPHPTRPDQVSMICPPELGSASLRPVEDATNQLEVVLAPNPALEAGPISSHLDFEFGKDELANPFRQTLSVVGTVYEPIRFEPPALAFGSRPVGESRSERLMVSHVANMAINIELIECSDPNVRLVPTEVPNVFEVSVHYTTAGQHTSAVTFVVNCPEENRTLKMPYAIKYFVTTR